MITIGFEPHDHARCIAGNVATADRLCQERRVQFTRVRRRVLEILLADHQALGAYDILEILREEGFGSQPPVVYRALDFLLSQGLAHRIERLNAFTACTHPEDEHAPAFLICRECETVAETKAETSKGALGAAARSAGFRIEQAVVEAEGLCPNCAKSIEG